MKIEDLRKHHVCQKHFEKKFIASTPLRPRLRVGAYPTLFSASEISSGIPQTMHTVHDSDSAVLEHSYAKKRVHKDHSYSKSEPTKKRMRTGTESYSTASSDNTYLDYTKTMSDVMPSTSGCENKVSENLVNKGINAQVFDAVKQEVKTWEENKIFCSIIFDEVALESGLTYERKQDSIIGFVELPEKTNDFADHALVFMLRGSIYKWQQPLAYYFCKGATSGFQLKTIIKDVVTAVGNTGLLPIAVVCDQGTAFQSALKSLQEDTRREQIRFGEEIDDIIMINGHSLSIIHDPPHLIKGLRNNFMMKDIKLENKISKWNDIVDVKNCVRVFSKTVAATLSYTAQFSHYADGTQINLSQSYKSIMILIKGSFLFLIAFSFVSSSRVLELSDKFIDISKDGMWFVKFYAPWCAHCRRLEPIWAHVAQSLYNTPIKVAKVDCTRFSAVATHFKIRAFPTIMFIKGSFLHQYNGEREKEEMVNYAMRMAQPAIQRVTHADSMEYLKETHNIFFGYVGKQQGPLWETFTLHAEKYQPHTWFYTMSQDVIKNEIQPSNDSAIFVYKEDDLYYFQANPQLLNDKETLNVTLDKWINAERFGFFPKITSANINHIMDIKKYIVIVIVSENKLGEITQTERDFKDMVESIIRKRKLELHDHFQFGWMGNPELANSIAMYDLTVPHLLVLNSTTSHHHLPEDDPILMTPEAVSIFLEQIYNQQAPIYGGNHWPVRIYRGFFEARTTLTNMWRGNPVLTALVFGLPLGFLSLICYSVCCADILDADEEEELESHEKKD
ncbi:unnamed protein product, partial [Iphiclides podalirius]